jgi:hypothetical protein
VAAPDFSAFASGQTHAIIDVLGYFNRPTNYGGTHVITGHYATDSVGFNNTASGSYSTVGGGYTNIAGGSFNGGFTTVAGGSLNTASGDYSAVGGRCLKSGDEHLQHGWGRDLNQTLHVYSTVAGGGKNRALSYASIVAGGSSNLRRSTD